MEVVREMAPGKDSGAIKVTNARAEGLRGMGVRLRINRGMEMEGTEINFHKLKSYFFLMRKEIRPIRLQVLPDLLFFGADFLF